MARNVISYQVAFVPAVLASALYAEPLACDLSGYKSQPGLTTTVADNHLAAVWEGDKGDQLMLTFALQNRAPVIQEPAVRRKGGAWERLAANVSPEFDIVSGKRVWGDGQHTDRKIVPTTELAPFGKHHFEISYPAGQKWVRFAAWDSAGNGAAAQPVKLATAAK